jgi:dihydroorotate dehydrogenase
VSWFYHHLIRPVLFTQDAEQIHNRMMRALGWTGRNELVCDALESFYGAPKLPIETLGLSFPNPVGLAAGMDKHAEALPAWAALGFGFTELGAVTWHAQPGNPAPRVFRAIPDEAIVNRMGFNSPGAEAVAGQLAEWKAIGRWPRHLVGMNLGKSRITPLEKAAEDYANSLRVLWPHVDFFVINVSSPNTPNLRQLQDKAALDEILATVQEAQSHFARGPGFEVPPLGGFPPPNTPKGGLQTSLKRQDDNGGRKPILVKVAPDLSFEALDEILELAGPRQVAGIVATNTTLARPKSQDAAMQRIYAEAGGLSGRPLRARSTEVIRHIYRQTRGALPIMGVGGIFDAGDAWEKITAGATLIQVYTGLVYEGPGIAKAIVTGLLERMEQHGITRLRQAIGTEAR